MKNKNRKRIWAIFLILAVAVISGPILKTKLISAVNADDMVGWLWSAMETNPVNNGSGTICDTDGNGTPDACTNGSIDGNENGVGWMSVNSANCDPDNDGETNGAIAGCPSDAPIKDYGVKIPAGDGPLHGRAWDMYLGWIDFSPDGGFPTTGCAGAGCPDYSAKRVGNTLAGWARFNGIYQENLIGNSGGWQGWIKLKGNNYGVTIDPVTGNLGGYGWSNELGWIDFSKAKITVIPEVDLSPDGGTVCPNTDFRLFLKTQNVTSCTSSGPAGNSFTGGATSGDFMVNSGGSGTKKYTVTCSNSSNTKVDTSTFLVQDTPCPPNYLKCDNHVCVQKSQSGGKVCLNQCIADDPSCVGKPVGASCNDKYKEVNP